MQSLISQIANLFATQSLKSIDNNGLSQSSTVNSEFGGLLESFSGDDYAANIAALDGNISPVSSYTPISFKLTQFAVTARPSDSNGEIEYSGQISSTLLKGSLEGLTNSFNSNFSALSKDSIEFSNPANHISLKSTTSHSLDGEQYIPVSASSTQLNDDLNLRRGIHNFIDDPKVNAQVGNQNRSEINFHNLVDEPTVNTQVSTHNQREVLHKTENVVNNYLLKDTPDDSYLDNAIRRNTENLVNSKNATYSNTNGADLIAKSNEVTTNSVVSSVGNIKPSDQSLSAFSVIPVDEKVVKVASTDAQIFDVKVASNTDLSIDELKLPSIKESVNDKTLSTDAKLGMRSETLNANNESVDMYNDNATTKQLITDSSSIDKEVIIAEKQIYNQAQLDEAKRIDNNAREEVKNFRSSSLDHSIDPGNIPRVTARNDVGPELNTINRNLDIIQDVKLSPNMNVPIDKLTTINSAPIEQLTMSNKVSGLERSPLLFNDSNQVRNGDDLAQQIIWAKNNNASQVRIAMSPEHLGALEINIEGDIDGLNIQFTTQNASAKDALETFMPRLKDMLEQNGLNLQNANVSQQDKGQRDNFAFNDTEQFDSQSINEEQAGTNGDFDTKESKQSKNYLLEAFA
ncbi:MAG: flagellar hook-length control protein FliK [Gammaproteobacteria bacterium]|nr:flagellar hook-length control protein FliK [Gammaproteobacteria bacterium]